MKKKCGRCQQELPDSSFSISKSGADGRSSTCKPCTVERNALYWKTPVGRISQIYAVQVVNSNQRNHPPPAYSRAELTEWAMANGLMSLVSKWEAAGYAKELTPSVDRKDPNLSYSLGNIRLVTWHENNAKAYADRKTCKHITKQNRKVEQLDLAGNHLAYFDSVASAARTTGAVRTNINAMCKGRPTLKSVGGFLWQYVP